MWQMNKLGAGELIVASSSPGITVFFVEVGLSFT
jgi:hypothetical protein